MRKSSLRLARIAISAALYAVMSLLIYPLSFGAVQIRFAEMLVLLCFFNKDYAYAMILGCFVVNLFSPLGLIDLFFGTLATLIAVIAIRYCKRIYLAVIPPVVTSIIIALELYLVGEPFLMSLLTVAIGELISVVIGYVVMVILSRRESFLKVIGADRRYYQIRTEINEKRKRKKDKSSMDLEKVKENSEEKILSFDTRSVKGGDHGKVGSHEKIDCRYCNCFA